MIRRMGEPVIRTALRRGMRVLARQFVMGRTIEEALARADRSALRYSFDMLGEAAKTHADAERYRLAYLDAIGAIGRAAAGRGPIEGPGISVKLSALHPRYEPLQAARCVPALIGTLTGLALAAKAGGYRAHRRCGGGRPAGDQPRHLRRRAGGSRGLPAGTGSVSPCRPTRSARCR